MYVPLLRNEEKGAKTLFLQLILPTLQTSEKKTLNHPEKWALLPITKRTPNIKNQDPFSTLGSLKLANLMFNWSTVENKFKLKVPFEGFTP